MRGMCRHWLIDLQATEKKRLAQVAGKWAGSLEPPCRTAPRLLHGTPYGAPFLTTQWNSVPFLELLSGAAPCDRHDVMSSGPLVSYSSRVIWMTNLNWLGFLCLVFLCSDLLLRAFNSEDTRVSKWKKPVHFFLFLQSNDLLCFIHCVQDEGHQPQEQHVCSVP